MTHQDLAILGRSIIDLKEALIGLRFEPEDGGCWGEPSCDAELKHHAPACQKAREALATFEKL